jgi:hypothetical protein
MFEEIYLLVGFVAVALILITIGIFKKTRENKKDIGAYETKELAAQVKGKKPKKLINKIFIKTEADFVGYQGSTPFVEFDENWNQMPLTRTKLTIPREHLTRMFPLAYLAGKLSAYEQGTKIGIVMILVLILLIASLGVTYFKTDMNSAQIKDVGNSINSTNGGVSELKASVANQNNLLNVIAQRLNITGNYSVPTVGG